MSNQTVEATKIREVLAEAITDAQRTGQVPTVDGLLEKMGVVPAKRATLSITVPVAAETEDEIRAEALEIVHDMFLRGELASQLSLEVATA